MNSDKEYSDFFSSLNKDKSGYLPVIPNFLLLIRATGGCPDEEDLDKWLSVLNISRDDSFTLEQFLEAISKIEPRTISIDVLTNAWKVMANGSGQVDKSYALAALTGFGSTKASYSGCFQPGIISPSEADEFIAEVYQDGSMSSSVENIISVMVVKDQDETV